jgi:hypothetical protein
VIADHGCTVFFMAGSFSVHNHTLIQLHSIASSMSYAL